MSIHLLASTENKSIDRLLRQLIQSLEFQFPNRIRGYYLEGSYADGTAVPASDVDLRVVFKDSILPAEQQQFAGLRDTWIEQNSIALDPKPESEESLKRIGAIRFQKATLLLYGEDIRATIPLKPIDEYIRDTVHGIFPLFASLRGNSPVLTYPLDYPDPQGLFFGYDRRQVQLLDGSIQPSIKDLAVHTLSTATARIAAEGRCYVVTKRDCVPLYRQCINDEWTTLVEDVEAYCRTRWGYLVPNSTAEQAQLRLLCQRSLAFQNDFLARYKHYLLNGLHDDDLAIVLYSVRRLGQLIYHDSAVVSELQNLMHHPEQTIRDAAGITLQHYSHV